jgi:uncharacterized protein (TIRG00374 family)
MTGIARPRFAGSRAVRWMIGIGVSIAASLLAIASVDVSRTAAVLSALDPVWLLPPLGVLAGQFAIRAVRWSIFLSAVKGVRVSTPRVVSPLLIGYLGNTVLPGRAGEFARTVLVSRRETMPVARVGATVLVERLVDLVALLGLGFIVLGGRLPSGLAGTGLLVLTGVAVLLVAARHGHRVGGRVHHLVERTRVSRAIGGLIGQFTAGLRALPLWTLALAAGVSLLAWVGDAAVWWFAARSLGIDLAPHVALALSIGAVLGTAVPAAPGYLGTYELTALAAASAVGLDPALALPIILVAHLLAVVPISVAGGIALLRAGAMPRPDNGGAIAAPLDHSRA